MTTAIEYNRHDYPGAPPEDALDRFSSEIETARLIRATELLGWRAQMPFEDGLRNTIEWFEANRHGAEARL